MVTGIAHRTLVPRYLALMLLAVAGLALPAAAMEPVPLEFRLFGTLGLASASSDKAEFRRDISQPDGVSDGDWSGQVDSLLGVQVSYLHSEHLEATAQAVSRYRYDGSWRPELTLAFVGYQPSPSTQLRAGRLGNELFALADSRLVGYSYLPVRPPLDFFGELISYHLDGLDLAHTHSLGNGLLRGKVFLGHTSESLPLEGQPWGTDNTRLHGAYLTYTEAGWSYRLAYGQARFGADLPLRNNLVGRGVPAPLANTVADALRVEGRDSRYTSIDLMYDSGPLQLRMSCNRANHEPEFFQDSRSIYLLGSYRLGKWTPYLGYSWINSRATTLTTGDAAADALISQAIAHTHAAQKTTSLGLRWDFRRHWDLKLQWDAVRGEPDSLFPYGDVKPGWDGDTDVVSLTLDFAY